MSTSRFHVTVPKLILITVIALGLGGCAGLSGFSPPVSALVFLIALTVGGVVGCRETEQTPSDGWTVEEDVVSDVPDAADSTTPDPDPDTARGEGRWVQCCDNGEIESCFCPAGVACNYGRFKSCGGDKCVPAWGRDVGCPTDAGDTSEPPQPDVPEPDTDVPPPDVTRDTEGPTDTARGEGRWVQCCENGEIDTCFCPAGVACNYGRFKSCGGGKCVQGFRPDVGCPVDAGGDTAGKF